MKTVQNENILIMIASYCDAQLYLTIENSLKNAAVPERIHFAVCYQDETTTPYYEKVKNTPHMKMVIVPPWESKGCGRARVLTQMLYDGEEYILQIDSHMRFIRNWDREIIQMLHACPSDKPLLSTYCPDLPEYELYLQSLNDSSIVLEPALTQCAIEMVPFRLLEFRGGLEIKENVPVPGAFLSGHFIFARANFIKEIPADPDLYFQGEETSLSVRAWTHGWDIFHPCKNLIFHKYQHKSDKEDGTLRVLHWQQHNCGLFDYLSKTKVKNIVLGRERGKYGVGDARTVEEYEAFSGVDFKNQICSEKVLEPD